MSPFKNLDCYRNLPSPLVVTFSGGRSSGYQLAHILEANSGLPDGAVVLFENTGFELPATYQFIDDFSRAFNVAITWLQWDIGEPTKVRVVNHDSASRDGAPLLDLFSTPLLRVDKSVGLRPLPNPVQRTCSANLKTKTAHRYARQHLGWPNRYWAALGYRADEDGRVKRRLKQEERYVNGCPEGGWGAFPMHRAGVTSEDVLAFWDAMPFDLGIESWEGNCDFCFMKSEWKLKDMMARYPGRLQPWLDLEAAPRDRSNRFRKDRRPLSELWADVQRGDMSATAQDPAIECSSCTGDFIAPEDMDLEAA